MRIVCLIDSLNDEKTVSTNFLIPSATEHETETAVAYEAKYNFSTISM